MKVESGNNIERVFTQQEPSKPRETNAREVKEATETRKGGELTEKEAAKVKEVVEKMNKELAKSDTEIEFKVHESKNGGLNKISIKVVDKTNDKIVVEIPSEESIEFSEKMDEITGMLFDHRG